jgi:membrane protease YdiL (CAAX protease family)
MQDESTPANAPPAAPVTGLVVVFALLLIEFYWPWLAFQALNRSGFYERIYGSEFVARAEAPGPPPVPPEDEAARDGDRYRLNLWGQALAFPLQVATVPVLFYFLLRVPPAALGLTAKRLGRNLAAGGLGFLLLTPAVWGVHLATQALVLRSGAGAVQEHPLTQLARGGATPAEWALIVFTAVVQAPVMEEILFRGMLQRTFARFRNGGHVAMGAAFLFTLAGRWDQAAAAGRSAGAVAAALAPVWFVLAMVPLYALVCFRSHSPVGPAVFGTALLFAAFHSSSWPAPVALFFLALGLGRLAFRTGSLAGPVLLHALFNGVSCVLLVLGLD